MAGGCNALPRAPSSCLLPVGDTITAQKVVGYAAALKEKENNEQNEEVEQGPHDTRKFHDTF